MTKSLRSFAKAQLDAVSDEYGPPPDRDQAIERWSRHLVGTSQVPDDILETMPEVSRHNEPQISPQEYECGCVTVIRVTGREYRKNEMPFEMRLALPCNSADCELAHLRAGELLPRKKCPRAPSRKSRVRREPQP